MTTIAGAAAAALLATTALAPRGATRQIESEMATRELLTRPETWNAEQRTIEVCWTTGARGARFSWSRWELIDEELATETSNVRLGRLNNGAAVLNVHRQSDLRNQIGVVVPGTARMENGEGIATVQFSARAEVADIVADIAGGIIRNLSVGYIVHEYEVTEREGVRALYRAVDWEPTEISFVPVGFDAGAQVRSMDPVQGGYPCVIRRISPALPKELNMDPVNPQAAGEGAAVETRVAPATPTPAPARREAPAQRAHALLTATQAIALTEQARAFGDSVVTRANELIAQNDRDEVGPDQVRSAIMEAAAEAQRARSGSVVPATPRDASGGEQLQARADATVNAILHRANPSRYQLDDSAREFRGRDLRGLARGHLEAMGTNTRGMSDIDVAQQVFNRSAGMHTTSDFPNILGSVVRRTLRDAYALAPRTYTAWSRRTTATDFRAITRVSLSDAPELAKVEEHGEYTYGTMGEGAETYRVAKYGKIIAVTWEAIVNDDLNALSRIPAAFGQSAAQKESDIVYDLLLNNPNMSDGFALFSSQHANLAGSGAAISVASLAAARAAMRKQVSPQGAAMNITPGILLVGPDKELEAAQFTSSNYVPVTNGTINPEWNRNLTVVVDPRITGNLWFLLADPAASPIDTIEYAYLDGEEGLMISQREGFEVDGLEVKARLVFGAGAIEHRGMYKNPGA